MFTFNLLVKLTIIGNFVNKFTYKHVLAFLLGPILSWFLFWIGEKIPLYFGIELLWNETEAFVSMIVLGLTFGYYFSRTMEESSVTFAALSSFLLYTFVIILVPIGPLTSSVISNDYKIAMAIPAIIIIIAYFSVCKEKVELKNFVDQIGGKLSWYYLSAKVFVIYEWPLFQKVLSMFEQGFDIIYIMGFVIVTIGFVTGFRLIYSILGNFRN